MAGFKSVRLLRFAIFQLWFCSLTVLLLSFLYNFWAYAVPVDSSELIKSASILLGLITPTLGAISLFYYQLTADSDRILEQRSPEFIYIAIAFSVLYHLVFCILVVAGVGFMALVRDIDPDRLYRNCVLIVNVIGLLSVLLGPGAWLFATSTKQPPQ